MNYEYRNFFIRIVRTMQKSIWMELVFYILQQPLALIA